MAQYIVTITPVLDTEDSGEEEASRTTMRVISEEGQAYIKELTVRVADNARLGPGDLMRVDLDVLLKAFAVGSEAVPAVSRTTTRTQPSSQTALRRTRAKTDRAYRRMPDPAEVKATYLASRTITGVAEHFGVPVHTAQGWVSRLRRKGVIPAGK